MSSASMWQGLVGQWGFIPNPTGVPNGAVTLPYSGGLILISFAVHTSAQSAVMVLNGVTIDLPSLTLEKHFNHVNCPLTSLSFANFGANDMWLIEWFRPGAGI